MARNFLVGVALYVLGGFVSPVWGGDTVGPGIAPWAQLAPTAGHADPSGAAAPAAAAASTPSAIPVATAPTMNPAAPVTPVVATTSGIWAADVPTALKLGSESTKLILLHFTATWCKPCQKLEAEVFNKLEFQQALTRGFVAAKVDLDTNKDLAKQYNVTALPADVILLPSGKFLYKVNCPPTAAEYSGQLQLIADAGKKAWQVAAATKNELTTAASGLLTTAAPNYRSDQPYTTPSGLAGAGQVALPQYASDATARTSAAANQWASQNFNGYIDQRQKEHDAARAAAVSLTQGNPPVVEIPGRPINSTAANAAVPGMGMAPFANSPWGNHPAPTQGAPSNAPPGTAPVAPWATAAPNAPTSSNIAPTNGNPYGPASPMTPWTAPTATRPGLAETTARPFTPTTTPPAANAATAHAPAMGTGPAASLRPAAAPSNVVNPYQPAPPTATPNGTRPAQPSATLRPVTPAGIPLGIGRLDPVRLCERRAPYDQVNEQFGAEHRGRIYLFSGQEEQQKFLANPDAYAPVLSGNDAVLAFDTGKAVAGSAQYGEFCNNRIYLFSSPETRQKFRANPAKYQQQLLQAEATTGFIRR